MWTPNYGCSKNGRRALAGSNSRGSPLKGCAFLRRLSIYRSMNRLICIGEASAEQQTEQTSMELH
jgi:hypothetical protein